MCEGKFLARFHFNFDKAGTSGPSDLDVIRTALASGGSNIVNPPRFRMRAGLVESLSTLALG